MPVVLADLEAAAKLDHYQMPGTGLCGLLRGISLRVKEEEFIGIVFSSSIALEAILFGVFGVLYSVYALYLSMLTPEDKFPPPICGTIRNLCRFLALLMAISTIGSVMSVGEIRPKGYSYLNPFGMLLMLPVVGMFVVTFYIAVIGMKER
jgi:hypothetical protein